MKFLLAGYFGFGNFGDEAILKYAIDVLRFYYKSAEISVITQNPHLIKKDYKAKGIYRFDLKGVITAIRECDFLIFPGGSVLQDITSIKSIVYYLSLIFMALTCKKKVLMIGQGFGPVNNKFARAVTYKLLKSISLLTVRDNNSYLQLKENNVPVELTADFLWAFTQNTYSEKPKEQVVYGEIACNTGKKKIGIQLRKWNLLTTDKLEVIAKSVLNNFPYLEYDYKLIALQPNSDKDVLMELAGIMKSIEPNADLELLDNNSIENNILILQSMDYMIAMRFHAGLCTINAEKSLLMISYDPKTEEFCKELGMEYVDIKELNQEIFNEKINWLKEFNPTKTALKTNILVKKSQQNVDYLVKEIV